MTKTDHTPKIVNFNLWFDRIFLFTVLANGWDYAANSKSGEELSNNF